LKIFSKTKGRFHLSKVSFIHFGKCKFSREIGRSRKAETSSYGRRLIINHRMHSSFVVFYLTSKYYIGSEKSRTNDHKLYNLLYWILLLFKGPVSSIFSITVKSQKTYFYLWKHKNNDPVVLKWVCLERDGQDGNGVRLENFWQNVSSFTLMSQIKYLETNFGLFLLLKIHLILSPCGLKAIHV